MYYKLIIKKENKTIKEIISKNLEYVLKILKKELEINEPFDYDYEIFKFVKF